MELSTSRKIHAISVLEARSVKSGMVKFVEIKLSDQMGHLKSCKFTRR